MNFQIGDHVVCVDKRGKDHLKVGNVRVVQAFNHKIKVRFEDGTESTLQAANNFEYFEDGKRKRGQGEEDNLQKSAAAMRMLKFKANQSEEEKQPFLNKDAARKRAKRQEHSQESKDVIRAQHSNRHQLSRGALSDESKDVIRAQDRHHHQLARETLNEESTAVKKKKKRKKLAYNFDTTRIPLTYYVRLSVCLSVRNKIPTFKQLVRQKCHMLTRFFRFN